MSGDLAGLRAQEVLADLRRRNGELFVALQEYSPERAQSFTPLPDYPTRLLIVDALVDCAVAWANGDVDVNAVREAACKVRDYWKDALSERKARQDRTAYARATARTARTQTQNARKGQA